MDLQQKFNPEPGAEGVGAKLIIRQTTAEIKNPISLARVILDESTKPLSLARVPPNLLVGAGATEYAYDKGVTVLPNEFLVSNNSRDRWVRWKQELRAADEKQMHDLEANQLRYADYDAIDRTGSTPATFSPPASPLPTQQTVPNLTQLPTPTPPLVAPAVDLPFAIPSASGDYSIGGGDIKPASVGPTRTPSNNSGFHIRHTSTDVAIDDSAQSNAKRQRLDGHLDGTMDGLDLDLVSGDSNRAERQGSAQLISEDRITDTVGAIAVDYFGNIAAGSSSGGIGMKHRGRIGPAALVGIGTAVVPVNPLDEGRTSVATVTSGTGEHMATTMAAATCADRIYSGVRKIPGGGFVKCSEDDAMLGMIKEEFMNHPGVRSSHCVGALGVMAVKKTKDGVFLYFSHNTDSFALASMHSEEKKPVCTMSRNTGNGAIAQGGRAAKYRQFHH
jgi:taspase, threonine aspartase, 1